MTQPLLKIDGAVARPLELSFADLAALAESHQVRDVSRLDPKRRGDAVSLAGVLALAEPTSAARYLTLHSSRDDFHASIPLEAVLPKAIVIYRLDGQPLPVASGGPLRFFVPDHAACHLDEIDECANVKFVDRIELSRERGYDNRPPDEGTHAKLHERESAAERAPPAKKAGPSRRVLIR